jgi:Lipocalin-like domain
MHRNMSFVLLLATTVLGASAAPTAALAQIGKDIVGTWTLVSNSSTASDGKRTDTFGVNPKGTLMFDANGRFTVVVMRSDLPKFAGKTYRDGTPEEYKAVGQGMLVTFGRYSIDEASKTITTDIEGSSFPNLAGGHQKRIVTSLTGDELKYRNPTGAGGDTVELVWKRAR